MRNPIIRRVAVTTEWQPLAPTHTVGSFQIRPNGASSPSLVMRGDDGVSEIPFERGTSFVLERVSLADIYVKGVVGDFIYVVGTST